MSIISITPAPVATGRRRRIVSDAVISAYINELASSARAEVRHDEQSDAGREEVPRVRLALAA